MKRKEKIAFSISPDLLARVDAMVDGEGVKSRSHAIEILLKKGLEGKAPGALVLAGGKGAPRSLEQWRASFERLVRWLEGNGVRGITFVGGREVEKAVRGLPAGFLLEKRPLGTAGALSLAKGAYTTTFIMAYADIVSGLNLGSMLEQHARERPVVTMALTEVENASKYGAVELEGLRIKGFVEKPLPGKEPSRLVNAGVYVLEPRIFEFLPKRGSFEREVLPVLARAGMVQGFVFTGEWRELSKG